MQILFLRVSGLTCGQYLPPVFSNPKMSLKGAKGRRSGFLSFRDLKSTYASSRGRRECGNRSARFLISRCTFRAISKVCGKVGKQRTIVFRAFHKPPFPRPLRIGLRSYAVSRSFSNSLLFASCIRRAASVSLMAAATLFSALILSPSRRYCAGLSNSDSVSSGVW